MEVQYCSRVPLHTSLPPWFSLPQLVYFGCLSWVFQWARASLLACSEIFPRLCESAARRNSCAWSICCHFCCRCRVFSWLVKHSRSVLLDLWSPTIAKFEIDRDYSIRKIESHVICTYRFRNRWDRLAMGLVLVLVWDYSCIDRWGHNTGLPTSTSGSIVHPGWGDHFLMRGYRHGRGICVLKIGHFSSCDSLDRHWALCCLWTIILLRQTGHLVRVVDFWL